MTTDDRVFHSNRTSARRARRRIGVLVAAAAVAGGALLSAPYAGAGGPAPDDTDCAFHGPASADALERQAEACEADDPCIPLGPGSPDAFERWIADCRARA